MFIFIPPLNKKSKPKLAYVYILLICALNSNLSNMVNMFFSQAAWIFNAFDYNTLTTTGVYRLSGAGPYNCTNAPSEQCTNCFVLVHSIGVKSSTFQIIFPGNNEHMWYRSLITDTTTWRPWKQIG